MGLRGRSSNPLSQGIPEDVRQQLAMLARAEAALFPSLLKDKIHRFIDSAKNGALRAEDIRFFLGTVDIPAGVCPTFVVRQLLIQDAVNTVIRLMQLPESIREQERILKVLKNLTKHRVQLPQGLETGCRDTLSSPSAEKAKEREPESEAAPFFNRQPEMNLIRTFVNSGDQRAFLVKGIRGIGKTAFVRRIFVDVLPKWRCVWVQIAQGISFEQLIAECAGKLDIPVGGIPSRRRPRSYRSPYSHV